MDEQFTSSSITNLLASFLTTKFEEIDDNSINHSNENENNGIIFDELEFNGDNLVLSPTQVRELCDFIEEARINRDRRIPQLEASLAEANSTLIHNAYLSVSQTIRPSFDSDSDNDDSEISMALLFEEDVPMTVIDDSFPMATTNKEHHIIPDTSISNRSSTVRTPVEAMTSVIRKLELEKQQLQETLERYETAVALYKGDQHMLLTDAINEAFSCQDFKPLTVKMEEKPKQSTAVETDLTFEEEKSDDILRVPSISSVAQSLLINHVQVSRIHVLMMQGCWMYKYPRSRFHRLIAAPCVPLGKLTYRFFRFCPVTKSINWATNTNSSSCKQVNVKRVVQERRKLEASHGTTKTGMVEVIVIIPESGHPLAIIAVDSEDNRVWKEGLIDLFHL